MQRANFESRVVAIPLKANPEKDCGTGILISKQYILTCAHVIGEALGLSKNALANAAAPDDTIPLSLFRFSGYALNAEAKIEHWYPPRDKGDKHGLADIALLRLIQDAPWNIDALPYLSVDILKRGDTVFAMGLSSPEGNHVKAEYHGDTSNWKRIHATTSKKFIGGLSGGPVVKHCSEDNIDKLVGMTVADGGTSDDGQMIAVDLLLNIKPVKAAVHGETLLEKNKPKAAGEHERCDIKDKILYFFDRDELLTEVKKRLQNSQFMVLAIKDTERDDYNSLSKRLLFEADEHQFRRDEQLWPIDFPALSREASLEKALVKVAEEHFFSQGFMGDKNPLSWHGIIETFVKQNFIGQTTKPRAARLVIELDFPEASIKRPALENLLVLIKEFIKLKKHLSDKNCKSSIFVVVYMAGRTPANNFLAKLSLSSLNKINFQTLCQYLQDKSSNTPFQFIANTLSELEEKDIQELDADIAHKLKVPAELLPALSRVAKAHLKQNGKASYSQLMNHIVTHAIYDSLSVVTDP